MVDPCFPEKQQHDWRYVYVCISYRKLYACIRIILHPLKYHIRKKWLCPGEHTTARWSLPAVHLIYSSSVEHWHWIYQTVRILCLTLMDPDRKVPDLYFKVVDPKLQVVDLKAEVGSWDPAGPPNSTHVCNTVVIIGSMAVAEDVRPWGRQSAVVWWHLQCPGMSSFKPASGNCRQVCCCCWWWWDC